MILKRFFPLAVFLLFAISACDQKNNTIASDLLITNGTLDNGLFYEIQSKPEPSDLIQLKLRIKSGSLSENLKESGYAHLLEHMAFNGTKNFPKNKIIKLFEKAGLTFGNDINAYTAYDETVYRLTIPKSNPKLLEDTVLYLSDILSGISFDQKELDKEKGVVQNELLSFGLSLKEKSFFLSVFEDLIKGSIFDDHLVIGSITSVENCTEEGLQSFYKRWYRPDNAQLLITGVLDHTKTLELIKNKFSLIADVSEKPKQQIPAPLVMDLTPKAYSSKKIINASSNLIFKLPKKIYSKNSDLILLLENDLLADLFSYRLKSENALLDLPFEDAGFFQTNFLTNEPFNIIGIDHGSNDFDRAVTFIAKQLAQIEQYGFTKDEFDQQIKLIEGEFSELENDHINQTSEQMGTYTIESWNNGSYIHTLESEIDGYNDFFDEISLSRINKKVKVFLKMPHKLIYSYVYKTKSPDLDNLQSIFEKSLKVTANKPNVTIGKLILPVIEKNIDEEVIIVNTSSPKKGIAKWELSNGVSVVLKPDHSEKNIIQIYFQAPGGANVLRGDQQAAVRMLIPVYLKSSLFGLTSDQLTQTLDELNIYFTPMIDANLHGLYSSSIDSQESLNLIFAIIYNMFTADKFDEKIVKLERERQIKDHKNYLKLPSSKTSARFLNTLYPNNPFEDPISIADQENVTNNSLIEIHKQFFTSANGFNLSIVGDFEIDEIKPLILKYIGTLPSGKKHKFSDRKQSIIKHAEKIDATTNPQNNAKVLFASAVRLETTGLKELYETQLLERIVDQKLTQVVREEFSLTYSPYVSIGFQEKGRSFGSSMVSVVSKVEDVQKTSDLIADILNNFIEKGIGKEQLAEHKKALIQNIKSELNDLDEKAYLLSRDMLYGYPLGGSEDAKDIIDTISIDEINRLIKKVFDPNRTLRFTNIPSSK